MTTADLSSARPLGVVSSHDQIAGALARDILSGRWAPGDMLPREAELLLFAASRAQLVREKIQPFLAGGGIVVADRFLDSTTVYQGNGRELPAELVRAVNDFAAGGCRPEVTFLLDLDAATGLTRARARHAGRRDRMEQAEESFYNSVRQGYLDLARREPERFCILDAALPPEALHAQIVKTLMERGNGLCS